MAAKQPRDIHRLFEQAFNAGNLDALVALYEPAATLLPQPGQPIAGLPAIREALQGFLALKGAMTLDTEYAVESGDIALLRGKWRLTGAGPDGKPVEMAGNSVEVTRRQRDGSWCFVIDHPFGAV